MANLFQKIRRWIGFSKPPSSRQTSRTKDRAKEISIQPRILPRAEHNLSRRDISKYALKVLYRLNEAGYQAYLVGGGVRDVLLGLHPKDFDVATNAHPETVSQLFNNSRLIGRRFRLVHVHFGRNIVEVATFRANPTHDVEQAQDLHRVRSSQEGMILRDNVYGSLEEDVFRRDFTINALYYNIADYTVLDFVNGLEDLKNKKIRVIGDPVQRYREDPLRMLRAIRFAAKLNFKIEPLSERGIVELQSLLLNVPAARLFDEYLKMFLSGYAEASYQLLLHYGLLGVLFPRVSTFLQKDPSQSVMKNFIEIALRNTDDRIQSDKTVSPHFLLATFLWYPLLVEAEAQKANGATFFDAFHAAMETILHEQRAAFAIPRRLTQAIKEIWTMQNRLKKRHRHRAASLFAHPRFRAAYDFLMLRAEVGESDEVKALCSWWTNYSSADESTRKEMADALKNEGRRSRKPSLRSKKPKSNASSIGMEG